MSPETPPSFTATTHDADISAYESLDLTSLNTHEEAIKPTSERLENFLIRVVFWAKLGARIAILLTLVLGLYGWTRNQTQSSWLMNLPISTAGSPFCTWMNHGYDSLLRKDTVFRDYLNSKQKSSLTEYIDNGRCIAPDTIETWLELQKSLASEELSRAYTTILPKKFLGTTMASSPELDIISQNSPSHRLHHDIILRIISDTADRLSDSTSRITCEEIYFFDLTGEIKCRATTKSPIQPRAKALDFMKALSVTNSLLVDYPTSLDMKSDEKMGTLITEFTAQMTYIPSRYEPLEIKKLTYVKR